jgi:SWIM zinc finger
MASTIVASYDFESDTWTHNGDNPARQAWRTAVAEIAEKAKAKLPESAGRVDSAVKIVLAGDVALLADGTAKVASQSNGSTAYHVVNGECSCKDFAKAPHQFCKHRLAAAITRRAQELVKAKLEVATSASQPAPAQPEAPTAPLPEAPVSITLKATLHGHEVMVTLRGVDFASVKAQVEQASQWLSVQAPAQPLAQSPGQTDQPPKAGWCAKHGVQMKHNHKEGRSWWSHWTPEGWCKGK